MTGERRPPAPNRYPERRDSFDHGTCPNVRESKGGLWVTEEQGFAPYAPPRSELTERGVPDGETPAGPGPRFVSWLIDFTAVNFVVQMPAVYFTQIQMGSQEELQRLLMEDGEAFADLVFGMLWATVLWSTLLGVVAYLAYYCWMEAAFGRTLGKMVVGTRVVTAEGAHPRFARILVRSFIRLIPVEPLSILLYEDRSMWHDRWTRTRVVFERKAREQPPEDGRE